MKSLLLATFGLVAFSFLSLAAPPVIVSPTGPQLVAVEKNAGSFVYTATVNSGDTQPTATLWVDLGWSFFAGNVYPHSQLPVTRNQDGSWTASVEFFEPTTWGPLPQLLRQTYWVVFSADGATAQTDRLQLMVVAPATQVSFVSKK